MCIYLYIDIQMYVYIYLCICIYVYLYTYVYIYMHLDIYLCNYEYRCIFLCIYLVCLKKHNTPHKLRTYKYRLSKMLAQFSEAKEALCTYMKKTILNDLECNGVDFTSESHYRKLLQHIYEYEVRFLRTKTHIPVHDGALLLGMIGIPCMFVFEYLHMIYLYWCIKLLAICHRLLIMYIYIFRLYIYFMVNTIIMYMYDGSCY
jgi:hypothetical protein